MHHVIGPALARGNVVICDQWTDSSIAQYGFGHALGPGPIGWLADWTTEHLAPDLVVLLDVDPQTGLTRVAPTDPAVCAALAGDRARTLAFHRQVRIGLLTRAQTNPHRYLQVNAADHPGDLHQAIAGRVGTLIENRAARSPRARAANVIPITRSHR